MAGFFGLFGNKTKYVDDTNQEDSSPQEEKKPPFFLTSDESKTMGNIDFMRSPISGKKKEKKTESNPSEIKPSDTNNGSTSRGSRSSSDPNLDMFRNMAKDIRKG